MPDELADQVVTHGVHQLSLLQVAEPVQEVSHPQRHGRLARARGAGEAHVQVRPGCLEAEPLPGAVDQEERRDLLHLLLDRQQADQVAVEGAEDIVDLRLLALRAEGDRRIRGQRYRPAAVPPGPPIAGPLWRQRAPRLCFTGHGRLLGSLAA